MSTELTRLLSGPDPGEQPGGLLARLALKCPGDADMVVCRIIDVLTLVFQEHDPSVVSVKRWSELLPDWFVRQCAADITQEEAERRRQLPVDERVALSKIWSLAGWIYWFRPSERPWKWWNSEVTEPDTAEISLIVAGFPYPSGAIEWLMTAAGARSIEPLE